MKLKVSLDNITITAYIRPRKLLTLKNLVESHTAISIQTAMTDMFRAYTKGGGQVVVYMEYDKIKGQAFNARPFRLEFNPNKLRSVMHSHGRPSNRNFPRWPTATVLS